MKKILFKDTLRQVWATKSRFISILAIIAIGCGFFAGVKVTTPDMLDTAIKYYDDQKLADAHVISTLGLDDDDIQSIKQIKDVDGFYAGYSADLFLDVKQGADNIVKTMSIDTSLLGTDDKNNINKPVLIKGRYPTSANECLIDNSKYINDFKLGDKITLTTNDKDRDINDILNEDTFTIVGIVNSPLFVNFKRGNTKIGNGEIMYFVMLPQEAYSYKTYTDVYLTLTGARGLNPYEDNYKNYIDGKIKEIEDVSNSRITSRTDDIQAEFNDAKAEYDKGLSEYQTNLDKFNTEIGNAQKTIETGKSEIIKNEQTLNDGLAQYNAGLEKWNAEGSKALAMLQSMGDKLDEKGKATLAGLLQTKATLDATDVQLKTAQEKLDTAKAQIKKGEAELVFQKKDGEQKLFDAKTKLDDAKKEIENNQTNINKLVANAKWYVLDRTSFPGNNDFKMDAERIDSIASVFPIFFILVAALVCFTTMTRMVEEQRTQIGVFKALGYSNFSIMSQFLIYSITASVVGGFIGLSIGFRVFPLVIFSIYNNMMYLLPDLIPRFHWDYAIGSIIVSMLCTGLAALLACYKELILLPAQLMRPKPPKNGKRVWLEKLTFLWKHLSFNSKVTCRNVFRYKDRVLMAVIGIAGCTALLLTGFGLRDSISSIVDKQYGEIFKYDLVAIVDDNAEQADKDSLDESIKSSAELKESMYALQKMADVSYKKEKQNINIFVPENIDAIKDYIIFQERIGKEPLKLNDSGVIINEKLGKLLGAKVGDMIEIQNANAPVKVSAITENYTFNYIYMSPTLYENIFDETIKYNSFLANLNSGVSKDSLSNDLLAHENVLSVHYNTEGGNSFKDLVKNLDSIVLLVITSAGALAFVVLYNLANINVTERIRELATIKVLGFYDSEVSGYIYRENTISAILGMLLGLFVGVFFEKFVVSKAEVDMVMFSPNIPISCFVISGLLTLVFTLIVNAMLHFKLKKIDMASSMKAIE